MRGLLFAEIQRDLILKNLLKNAKIKAKPLVSAALETAPFDSTKLQERLHATRIIMLSQLLSPQHGFYSKLAKAYLTRQTPSPLRIGHTHLKVSATKSTAIAASTPTWDKILVLNLNQHANLFRLKMTWVQKRGSMRQALEDSPNSPGINPSLSSEDSYSRGCRLFRVSERPFFSVCWDTW